MVYKLSKPPGVTERDNPGWADWIVFTDIQQRLLRAIRAQMGATYGVRTCKVTWQYALPGLQDAHLTDFVYAALGLCAGICYDQHMPLPLTPDALKQLVVCHGTSARVCAIHPRDARFTPDDIATLSEYVVDEILVVFVDLGNYRDVSMATVAYDALCKFVMRPVKRKPDAHPDVMRAAKLFHSFVDLSHVDVVKAAAK